jgi:pimeloyl-ACP methyl ester carboxylesterase
MFKLIILLKIFAIFTLNFFEVVSFGFNNRNQYVDDALDLIKTAGYQGEAHQVEPIDAGWILKVHRIPPKTKSTKYPVFLMHGLFATSADYLVTGRKSALAFLLADNGYDVWMGNNNNNDRSLLECIFKQANLLGNARGNRHAIINYQKANLKTIWDFSFHEMGLYDLPAMIDHMLAMTNSSKFFYVGHSQVLKFFYQIIF